MLRIDRAAIAALPPDERARVEADIAQLEAIYEQDPLQRFEPNCSEQARFMAARTNTQAAFAGNQAGKTTGLVVKALIQVTPPEKLPERLLPYKRFGHDKEPVFGRIVNPGAKQLGNTMLPTFRAWTPKHLLKDGSFDRAWRTQDAKLEFVDGSFIDFLTYEQELDKFGGPQRHFLGYDEPPPREIRDEGLARLVRYGGFEMFALTPLKANTGWLRREIWRKRASENITVAKWSIRDNKALSQAFVDYFLASLPNDLWRRAREFGDFVDIGGLMYPGFEDALLREVTIEGGRIVPVPDDPDGARAILRERVKGLEIVVGIDPGIRNAALVWVGFDRDNRGLVFDEVLLQQKLPSDYAQAIRSTNAKWDIRPDDVTHVIDPAYRQRAQADGENVETALVREGIYCVPGNHNLEAGVMQVRQRYEHGMLEISPAMLGLRDEADEYAMEDREDGVFKEERNDNSHRLDALRYVAMHRTWDPIAELEEARGTLGWTPGEAPGLEYFQALRNYGPMGSMS